MQVKPDSQAVDAFAVVGGSQVGPFPRDGEAAAFGVAQDQRVDPRDAPRLEHSKALAATWMERMPDLSPTRRVAGRVCS